MIDYFALALGHGLLAIALLRLMMREGLDSDPLISGIEDETKSNRKAASVAGRNAARRAKTADPDEAGEDSSARAADAKRSRRLKR